LKSVPAKSSAIVLSVNISKKKGIAKDPVPEVTLKEDWGIVGDVHAGPGEKQVSFLAQESVDAFQPHTDVCLKKGIFAENITTKGINLRELEIGQRLTINDCILEVSKKGKECHQFCNIAKIAGKCIMPKECIFVRVVKGGKIRKGDGIALLPA
jgi:cyclic pyranopterin phosphate synthase